MLLSRVGIGVQLSTPRFDVVYPSGILKYIVRRVFIFYCMQKEQISKKMIGTSMLAVVMGATFLVGATFAQARFFDQGTTLSIDAVVDSLGASSLVALTVGADPLTIGIDSRTNFVGGPLAVGDTVHISARTQAGTPVARVVRKTSDGNTGYGFPGDRVTVRRGEIIAKSPTAFTIESDNSVTTFEVTSSTSFGRDDYAFIGVGTYVTVSGYDSGSNFVANTVRVRP